MAAADPAYAAVGAGEGAVFFYSRDKIGAARRLKAAILAQQRAEAPLVEPCQQNQQSTGQSDDNADGGTHGYRWYGQISLSAKNGLKKADRNVCPTHSTTPDSIRLCALNEAGEPFASRPCPKQVEVVSPDSFKGDAAPSARTRCRLSFPAAIATDRRSALRRPAARATGRTGIWRPAPPDWPR